MMSKRLQVQIRQTGPSTSEVVTRGHRVTIDRPVAKGGADAGPMGGELFLAAVGGCFMSNLLAAIQARGLDIPGVATEVTAELVGTPDRFVSMELLVSADTGALDTLVQLVEIADRGCIMMNTLRGKFDITARVRLIDVTV